MSLTKTVFAIMLSVCTHLAIPAAACEIGEYISNGQCVRCGVTGYYCPDGVNRFLCPGYNRAIIESWVDCPVITAYFRSWGLGLGDNDTATQIENCLTVVRYDCPQGSRYLETNSYVDNGTDMPYTADGRTIWWQYPNPGYYLAGTIHSSGTLGTEIAECTNAPAHAHYTGHGTPKVGNCPWECDCGYVRSGDACVPASECTAGVKTLRTGTGLIYKLYSTQTTSPTIAIGLNGNVCYACLAPGAADGALNLEWDAGIFHAVNGE